jgi:hypothetical protein
VRVFFSQVDLLREASSIAEKLKLKRFELNRGKTDSLVNGFAGSCCSQVPNHSVMPNQSTKQNQGTIFLAL